MPVNEKPGHDILNGMLMRYGKSMSVAAVIVAGGSGQRAGGSLPKQYQLVGGIPVIRRTLEAFLNHPIISRVQVVIGQGHETLFQDATRGMRLARPVIGGGTRQDSCSAGLEACAHASPAKVLIHDAARPFLSANLISEVVRELDNAVAVIPGLPVADTMKFAPSGIIEKTVDRSSLWFVQTPQGFHFDSILDAHRKAAASGHHTFTDDAAVAEFAGMQVRIIAGEQNNKKLTTEHDIVEADREYAAKTFEHRPDVRTGLGIDFHVFTKGKGVVLCGVTIPHTHRLKGHSDADVALHAITDAILGALGERDIGQHFPSGDPAWKNAQSSIFVKKAMALLQAKKGVLANIDLTILAEEPRIGPHIDRMRSTLSSLLEISHNRIGIKATTTERMGAIGRKEGISAQAIATIRLPA